LPESLHIYVDQFVSLALKATRNWVNTNQHHRDKYCIDALRHR
jgi:hypothetical protein